MALVALPSRGPGAARGDLALAAAALALAAAAPLFVSGYAIEAILLPFLALSLAAVGLNLLTGFTGQPSLGSAAFLAIGAYGAYNLQLRIGGLPLPLALLLAGAVTALVGMFFGLPSLRLRGFYLAVSTLAAQFFVQWALTRYPWFSNGSNSGVIDAPPLRVAGVDFSSASGRYYFSLVVVALLTAFVYRVTQSPFGKDLVAIRDNEIAAGIVGVRVARLKLAAFGLSSFVIGVAGALWAFAYLRTVEPAGFNLDRSFQILFIVIIGGLGALRGSFLGALLLVVFPLLLSRLGAALLGESFDSGVLEMSQRIILGVLIIVFLVAEPNGLAGLFSRAGLERVAKKIRRPLA